MRFGSTKGGSEEEAFDINVIPLIDVLLVLLIFFMVSSSFVAASGFDVKLPSATQSLPATQAENLTVSVNRSGVFAFQGKEISREELERIFQSASSKNPKPLLIIRADEHTEHGSVVALLDLAKRSGLEDVAIAAALEGA